MGNKKKEQIIRETRTARLDLMKLIDSGMDEVAALKQVLPHDKNRHRTLRQWKDAGLYPVPAEEPVTPRSGVTVEPEIDTIESGTPSEALRGHTGEEPAIDEALAVPDTGGTQETSTGLTQPLASGLTEEQEAEVVKIVHRELAALVAGVKPEPLGKPGRGHAAQTVKKTFTIPVDLWKELNKEFPGAIMSNHVSAALRLYLNTRKITAEDASE
jgi:hypothetical protein